MQTAISETAAAPIQELEQFRFYPWIVLIAASCFFFYEFMQMNMFNAIDTAVRNTFFLDATALGRIAAYYAFANLIFLFPAGVLLDRFSTKKIILIAMVVCAGATFALSQAQSVWVLKLCRFMTGVGGSFCLLSCVRLASRWFAPRHMALATGVIVTFGMLGGAMAQAPLTYLVEQVGWRHAVLFDSLLGLAIIMIIIIFVKDYPQTEQRHYQHGQEVLHKIGFWHSIKLAFTNKQNFLGGLYTSLVNLPIALLGAAWGAPYLHYARGLTESQAALVTTMIFVGTIVGSPLVSWLSDALARRRMPMLVGGLLSLVLMLLVIYLPITSYKAYMALFFLLGFITSSQVITYPLISESNPSYLTGTSTSIASMLILGGYAVFGPFYGWLMDVDWHGHLIHGIRSYTEADFHYPMLVFPIAFVVALIAAWFIRETYCQAVGEE